MGGVESDHRRQANPSFAHPVPEMLQRKPVLYIQPEVEQTPRFRLRTLEELEATSASRRDHIPAILEASMLRTAVYLIIVAGDKLKM